MLLQRFLYCQDILSSHLRHPECPRICTALVESSQVSFLLSVQLIFIVRHSSYTSLCIYSSFGKVRIPPSVIASRVRYCSKRTYRVARLSGESSSSTAVAGPRPVSWVTNRSGSPVNSRGLVSKSSKLGCRFNSAVSGKGTFNHELWRQLASRGIASCSTIARTHVHGVAEVAEMTTKCQTVHMLLPLRSQVDVKTRLNLCLATWDTGETIDSLVPFRDEGVEEFPCSPTHFVFITLLSGLQKWFSDVDRTDSIECIFSSAAPLSSVFRNFAEELEKGAG